MNINKSNLNKKGPQIWAVAGGKGGTGKSFLSCLLSMQLAHEGRKTILVDADYEGANIHSFLGLREQRYPYTLSDFFSGRIALKDAVVDTHIPNLSAVVGDVRVLDPQGLKFFLKQKLMNSLSELDAEIVIVDLGAGSSHNTIDTFLSAHRMIAVTTPQTISIDNLCLFLNKCLFRKLNLILEHHHLKQEATLAWQNRGETRMRTINDFIGYLRDGSSDMNTVIARELADFAVHIVMNQVHNASQIKNSAQLQQNLNNFYGIRAESTGFINFHPHIWEYNNQLEELFEIRPRPALLNEVEGILRNMEDKPDLEILTLDRRVPMRLIADSPNAVAALNGKKIIEILRFPFSVGRYSEKRMDQLFCRTDLYLRDSEPFTFSRNHFSIDEKNGGYLFRDRDSHFGALVNQRLVGGENNTIEKVPLRPGQNSLSFGNPKRELRFILLVTS